MPKSPTSHYQAASFCHSTSDMSIYLAAVPQRLQLVGLMIQYNVLVILVPVLLANIVCESEKNGCTQPAKEMQYHNKFMGYLFPTSVKLCWSGHSLDI